MLEAQQARSQGAWLRVQSPPERAREEPAALRSLCLLPQQLQLPQRFGPSPKIAGAALQTLEINNRDIARRQASARRGRLDLLPAPTCAGLFSTSSDR